MERISNFDIPLESLRLGEHEFVFELNDSFFKEFETGLLTNGAFNINVLVDKLGSQTNISFHVKGTTRVECDRCLDSMIMPMDFSSDIVVKFHSSSPLQDDNVYYLSHGQDQFNLAKPFYDVISLNLPIASTHDMINEDCNPEMMKYLDNSEDATSETQKSNHEIPEDSPWNALRNFKSSEN